METESSEDELDPSRTHWRNEIPVPDYAKKFVRERCKRFSYIQRENAWKESSRYQMLTRRYLAYCRSRDAQKGFFDWGNESIIHSTAMKPLLYDEITCTSYLEYRFHKKFVLSSCLTGSYGICTRIYNDTIPSMSRAFEPLRVLDIGCGSGAASLLCLLFRSYSQIDTREISLHRAHIAGRQQ